MNSMLFPEHITLLIISLILPKKIVNRRKT